LEDDGGEGAAGATRAATGIALAGPRRWRPKRPPAVIATAMITAKSATLLGYVDRYASAGSKPRRFTLTEAEPVP